MGRRKRETTNADLVTRGSTFGDLLRTHGFESSTEAESPPPPNDTQPATDIIDLASTPALRLRRERKGRGGHPVIIVEGITASPLELTAMAKALGKDLGCRANVDGGFLIVGMTDSERIRTWLHDHGASNIQE